MKVPFLPLRALQAPGMDPFRPDQRTPVPNFFLAGSYTKQDYIDRWAGPLILLLLLSRSMHVGNIIWDIRSCC